LEANGLHCVTLALRDRVRVNTQRRRDVRVAHLLLQDRQRRVRFNQLRRQTVPECVQVGTAFIGPSTAAYPNRSQKPHLVSFITRAGKRITFIATKVTVAMVGRFLEYGTSKMAAHPWMTRAWDKSKQAALDHIIEKLKEQLKLT
jgi:hypothetical protein